ncbi:MAG: hypothetical protein IT377_01110 [Polyangiaceae bacterium]|nr:hypothetical protein [Polyangiaceae bacterium]
MAKRKADLSEFQALTRVSELEEENSKLQASLRRERERKASLVEATLAGAAGAMVALGQIPPVPKPKAEKRKAKGEVALWHLTDWQGSKVTTTYNSEVMRERVLRFCEKAARLTEIQRAAHPVRECVILFGGDQLEGLFNYPSQPFEIDASLFGQFCQAARLEAEVVRQALATYEKVTVVSEWGNHGRVGSKRSAVPPSDNMDRMAYELARAILSDPETGKLHPRLEWADDEEDIHHFTIGNYSALLIHGDEVGRGGYASPDTVARHIAGWKSGAYDKPFRDVYMGHIHRHDERALPDGEGALYITGSPETDNRYARDKMAAAGATTQRLHFVEPVKGHVTAQYRVRL